MLQREPHAVEHDLVSLEEDVAEVVPVPCVHPQVVAVVAIWSVKPVRNAVQTPVDQDHIVRP